MMSKNSNAQTSLAPTNGRRAANDHRPATHTAGGVIETDPRLPDGNAIFVFIISSPARSGSF